MDHILKKLEKDKIRFDCKRYSGYKPCGISEFCEDCPGFEPVGPRILIIKLAAMGDVLRTTAILPGLKNKYPDSHITWITDASSFPLLKDNRSIDRLLIFDIAGVLTTETLKYDIAINFEKEARALALFQRVDAPQKLGFAFSESFTLSIANHGSLYALQLGLHDELKFKHNRKTYQKIIYEMAEIPYEGQGYDLNLSAESGRFASELKKKLGLKSDKISIGLNTGCGGVFETKRWTMEGFCELERLLDHDGHQILLLGGKRECGFNRDILEKSRAPLIDTGCDNTLEDFLGVVSLCDLVASSDSLAAHISLALGKETVIFFGSTCAQELELFGRGEAIVSDFPCSPCYKNRCDKNPTCMEALSPLSVYDAICRRVKILQSRRM